MDQKDKIKTLDKINDAFISQGMKERVPVYERVFEKVITRSINTAKDGEVTSRQIKAVINKIPISPKAVINQTYEMMLLSGITNVIENQRLVASDKLVFEPINRILQIYTPRNPERLAKKANMLVKAYLTNEKLSGKDSKALENVTRYFEKNKKFIRNEIKKNLKRFDEVNKMVKDSIGKAIRKDLKREINAKIETTVNGETVTRPKTYREIRKDMQEKYGKQIQYRVNRIVDTELHSLAETTKINQHAELGYTHKRWNSQRDSRVRDTYRADHEAMQGVTVKIDKKFRVKGGGWAMYPGDPNLPPRQYINCRCFCTYVKRYNK